MWLLVRGTTSIGEAGDDVVATCPETAQGREAWQWTVSRGEGGAVLVDTDPVLAADAQVHHRPPVAVLRGFLPPAAGVRRERHLD